MDKYLTNTLKDKNSLQFEIFKNSEKNIIVKDIGSVKKKYNLLNL